MRQAAESPFDTIVAPISGIGAVAVVRLSGSGAWEIAGQVFAPWNPRPMRAKVGRVLGGDEGIALPFAEGRSYTGEASVEISVHGSPAAVRGLLEACIGCGARMALPGEFTQRAWMNGRLDLTQAEGVMETVAARTETQLRVAHHLREGRLGRAVEHMRDRLVSVLAQIEASVDFAEETGPLDAPAVLLELESVLADLQALLHSAAVGRRVREGFRVALVGRPNVGKSSLLNALLQSERAIVTDLPGTTRDVLEESLELDGHLVVLVDTAGLREPGDQAESEGVRRARAEVAKADWVWQVLDSEQGWTAHDDQVRRELPHDALAVWNKADLAARPAGVSARTGHGLQPLIGLLRERLQELPLDQPIARARHLGPLREAVSAVEEARQVLADALPDDLAAVGLQAAIRALGEVTGETTPPDVVERLFRDFCIGK